MPSYASLNGVLEPNAEEQPDNWGRGRDRMRDSFPEFFEYIRDRYTGNMTQYDCCAQFCTTRAQIQTLPRRAYEVLAQELRECKDQEDMTGRCAATLEMN